MANTGFWENEMRDARGRWTAGSGAAGAADAAALGALTGKLAQGMGKMLGGVHGGNLRRAPGSHDPAHADAGHRGRMAELFLSWEQARDWSDRAFRDHFLSPMHRQAFSDRLRRAAHALATARTREEVEAAAADLGWWIGQYGPGAWIADVPVLQRRAAAALDPQGQPLSLSGYGTVDRATAFEYQGRKDRITRARTLSPAFEPPATGPDGRTVAPPLAPKPVRLASDVDRAEAPYSHDSLPVAPPTLPVNEKKERFVHAYLEAARQAAAELGVPVENILGLAAVESGWGGQDAKARFTREGNNFFGQHYPAPFAIGWIWNEDHTVKVAKFASFADSVRSFVKQYGDLVRGVQDPETFVRILQNAGLFGIEPDGTPVSDYVGNAATTIRRLRSIIHPETTKK